MSAWSYEQAKEAAQRAYTLSGSSLRLEAILDAVRVKQMATCSDLLRRVKVHHEEWCSARRGMESDCSCIKDSVRQALAALDGEGER